MAGDKDFETAVRGRVATWRRVAFLLCNDWSTADDIVQTALLRLHRRWHHIDPLGLEPYARQVIGRLAIDEGRRAFRRAEISGDPPDGPVPAVDRDALLDVNAALSRLSVAHRAVLVMRFYLELSVAETAAALKISEGTVKSQTTRALGALRTLLGPSGLELGPLLPWGKEAC